MNTMLDDLKQYFNEFYGRYISENVLHVLLYSAVCQILHQSKVYDEDMRIHVLLNWETGYYKSSVINHVYSWLPDSVNIDIFDINYEEAVKGRITSDLTAWCESFLPELPSSLIHYNFNIIHYTRNQYNKDFNISDPFIIHRENRETDEKIRNLFNEVVGNIDNRIDDDFVSEVLQVLIYVFEEQNESHKNIVLIKKMIRAHHVLFPDDNINQVISIFKFQFVSYSNLKTRIKLLLLLYKKPMGMKEIEKALGIPEGEGKHIFSYFEELGVNKIGKRPNTKYIIKNLP